MPALRPGLSFTARAAALGASILAVLILAAPTDSNAGRTEHPSSDPEFLMRGTWEIRRVEADDEVWLSLHNDNGRGSNGHRGTRLSASELAGLPGFSEGNARKPVELRLQRDAGTLHLTGEFAGPRGAGTFELELDPEFPARLERRGVGRPSQVEQAKLLLAGSDFSLLDALERERYQKPRIAMLIRMADHGVDERYVTGMARLGHRLASLDQLVKARDHGVDPGFIEGMAQAGYENLEFETLLRARDHGADPDFVADMNEAGYGNLPLATLIRARDHGVSASFAKRVRTKRPGASLEDVIAMRNRGSSP